MEVLTYTYLEQVVLPCPCKFVKILTIWNNASWYILKKIHSLRGSSALKFHAKNRYVTNHEARGAISIFHTGNIIGIHKSGYEFSLNFISFFLSERKPVSFTSVNVGASWSKAIPVESTVSNQKQKTLVQPRGRQPSFKNCLYKIYTINLRKLVLIVFRVIVLLPLQCNITESLALRSRNSTLNTSPRRVTNQSARIL